MPDKIINETIYLASIYNIYESADSPLARSLFADLIKMRAEGWLPEYPKNYLPFDSSDFVGVQHLFCIRENGQLRPIGGFRQISLRTCEEYGIKEAHCGLLEKARSPEHTEALKTLFETAKRENRDLISTSKVTLSKSFRGDRAFSEKIREILAATFYNEQQRYRNPIFLGSGVLRFKTDQLLFKSGFKVLEIEKKPLPPVQIPEAGSEPILLMSCDRLSKWVEESFYKHKNLINSRIIIDASESDTKVAA